MHSIAGRPTRKLVAEDMQLHMLLQSVAQLGSKETFPIRSLIADAEKRKAWSAPRSMSDRDGGAVTVAPCLK